MHLTHCYACHQFDLLLYYDQAIIIVFVSCSVLSPASQSPPSPLAADGLRMKFLRPAGQHHGPSYAIRGVRAGSRAAPVAAVATVPSPGAAAAGVIGAGAGSIGEDQLQIPGVDRGHQQQGLIGSALDAGVVDGGGVGPTIGQHEQQQQQQQRRGGDVGNQACSSSSSSSGGVFENSEVHPSGSGVNPREEAVAVGAGGVVVQQSAWAGGLGPSSSSRSSTYSWHDQQQQQGRWVEEGVDILDGMTSSGDEGLVEEELGGSSEGEYSEGERVLQVSSKQGVASIGVCSKHELATEESCGLLKHACTRIFTHLQHQVQPMKPCPNVVP